jgi:YD repeat-containing protein
VLGFGLVFAAFFILRAPLVGSPVYKEAIEIAKSSTELQSLVGQPIQDGWASFGEIRAVYGSEFAEWTTPLKGPKGRGRLHVVANRIGSTWQQSRLLYVPEDGRTKVDITPVPKRDALVFAEGNKKVYLVPLGTRQAESLDWAPAYYKAKFGLEAEVLSPVPIGDSAWNTRRHQVIAEKLIAGMKNALPEQANDTSAIVIGVTSEDMYIQTYDWRYAINYREDGHLAVVSTARLQPFPFYQQWNKALAGSRLQKMLNKNVYVLSFYAPLSSDYTSAVSGGVMSPDEVDYMSDQLIGAEGSWNSFLSGGDPIVSMIVATGKPVQWTMEGRKPPADFRSELFTADLKFGLFYQRKTDFRFGGEFPLEFDRVYHNQDDQSHSFGMGATHSLDTYIAGKWGAFQQLTFEYGGYVQFDLDTSPESRGKEVYRAGVLNGSPYSRAKIEFEGYGLRVETMDGWRYSFPYHPKAPGIKSTALTGYGDPQGNKFEMVRNDAGDLLSITTPAHQWLHFGYDNEHRIHRIEASDGRVVNYDYDADGRLSRVRDSEGNSEGYLYDEKNQMRAVLDGSGNTLMTIAYSPEGWVTGQSLKDGREFQYGYLRNAKGELKQNQFIDPQGSVTVFNYSGGVYRQSLPSHPTNRFSPPQ